MKQAKIIKPQSVISETTRQLTHEAHDHYKSKHHFRKAQRRNFEGCAERWNKDSNYRKCMQENSRSYGIMESWVKIAKGPRKTHTVTPQQLQANFGNQWYVVQTTAGGSNTVLTRQHPELRHAYRARMNYQSVQRATASHAGSSSMEAQWPRKNIFNSQNATNNLAI